jgi:hypothetical protein
MNTGLTPGKRLYVGLFILTLSTLMYEVLLTRIFSVTMWYHFAFMAISIAIFGMSGGALLVYLLPGKFRQENGKKHLAASSFLFSLSILLGFYLLLNIPAARQGSVLTLQPLALTYIISSVPFFFSGICICLALTKFPREISKLYAADMLGSAAGCILLIQLLEYVDAPTAVIVVALLACMGSFLFASEAGIFPIKLAALFCGVACMAFTTWHSYLFIEGTPILRLQWVKGKREPASYLYERWNSFSRVTVSGSPYTPREPFGWGLSAASPPNLRTKELKMEIDGTAGTILTGFDGDLKDVEYLRYDVTNLVHYIKPHSNVLVIGVGGGRDILSALAFNQNSVTGVEMNDDIVQALNGTFGDFTGHLDRNPRVHFVTDEARSWITRQSKNFDIIQLSLIDTWAATSAGAFVLAENSLYTVEAWDAFLDHLATDGVMTVSRWYHRLLPAEMYRLSSLAAASLKEAGVKDPSKHVVIIRRMIRGTAGSPDGIGTLLLSKRPFTAQDLATLRDVVDKLGFEFVYDPGSASNSVFRRIISAKNVTHMASAFPLDITPPTDNSPFFFNMLRIRDAFNSRLWQQGNVKFNMEAVFVLAKLLMIVIILTLLFLILPLAFKRRRTRLTRSLPFLVYFGGIGLGFMLIEISQMQRLIIFLGHPTYGLSVVLFSLLLSSGIGSYLSSKVERSEIKCLALLMLAMGIYGLGASHVINALESCSTPVRIMTSMLTLFPVGIFMGMAFPIGMKMASNKCRDMTPWFWAINGTTSVTASVLTVAISINWSISAAYWTGFVCYGFSFLAILWLRGMRLLNRERRDRLLARLRATSQSLEQR